MNKIKVKIEKAVFGGSGLGYHDGKAVFVPYTVPGDEAEVIITKKRGSYSSGLISRILVESPDRIKARCPNFGKCGGCDYLNISYEKEIEFKQKFLVDSLTRIGKLPAEKIPEIKIYKSERFHYRSHAVVKIINGQTGFYQKDSHNLAPLPPEGCLLLADEINKVIAGPVNINSNELKIALSLDRECVLSTEKEPVVHETENGILYDRDISIFFQANRFLRGIMLDIVKDCAGLHKKEALLDIGCGAGFFTLYLSADAKEALGIDINSESIKWAEHNAELNNRMNTSFASSPSSGIHQYKKKYTVIIADPPRAGLSKKTRKSIKAMAPRAVIYVSCNPATFARDIADITGFGYSLEKLSLIDMFPGTRHIESIGLLRRQISDNF